MSGYFTHTLSKKPKSYILWGQSLGTGEAPIGTLQSDLVGVIPNASIYNVLTSQWEELQGGVNNAGIVYTPFSGVNFGVELRLMKLLQAYYKNRQYLHKWTWEGSGLTVGAGNAGHCWQADSNDLFSSATASFAEAQTRKKTTPQCVLWIQGEGDTVNTGYANQYETHFAELIQASRAFFGNPNLHWFVKTLGNNQGLDATCKGIVNAAMVSVSNSLSNVHIVSGDNLGLLSDQVHLNASGNDTMAHRFFDAITAVYP